MEDYIYEYITKPFFGLVSQIPIFAVKFVVFVAIIVVGYVVGRIAGTLVRVILDKFLEIEDLLKQYKLENALYGKSLTNILVTLTRWWFYMYFLATGISIFGYDVVPAVVLGLKSIYASIGLFIFGLYVSEFVKNVIENTTIKEKETIKTVVKGVLIYIFFVLALQNIGINAQIFLDILRYFALAAAISFGAVFGVYLILEHKEDILEFLKK
jgi:hypothetical protein